MYVCNTRSIISNFICLSKTLNLMTFNTSGGDGAGGLVGISSKLSLCLLYFILAVISGWALKHNSSTLAGYAYGLYLAHSLVCILRQTHPNPGIVQRTVCEQSHRYAPVAFITLIVGELLAIRRTTIELGANWAVVGIGFAASLFLLAIIKCFIGFNFNTNSKSTLAQNVCLNLCVLWNAYCLCRIAFVEDQFYWALGLAMLVLLNHFVLIRLTLYFNITHQEIGTVGMCFSTIFAINAIQELAEALVSR
ncbi:uncharacterized protein LOC115627631 [Scaptodrosophila lebanonensis]|uniref:Uncharacterized protein LOC115627631 n=1 Tax=Drosophila lebanonensis TaxID=7225 RepID=A0A6J2TWG0_DROLE|nr:uncharacterized protein LOC115627631 [Scaptodrosophila lebanonensis]